ncbi:uncharacterized protein LOC113788454 [Dermatophagoides pteronyssinus]|uniref:uncharacterized protein LOC113788454 n=1 Tax=Dermatophagoides pteronyssinus TaxID=6956 RepID=UPI003F663982
MMTRKFSLIIAIWMILTTTSEAKKKFDCDHLTDLANDVIIVTSKTRKFPTTLPEFSTFCKQNLQLAADVTTMSKQCFKNEMKNIIALVGYSYRQRMKLLCKRSNNNSKANAVISAAPCLNRFRSKMAKCFDRTANRIAEIKSQPNNLKFPYLCCETGQIRKCIEKIQSGDCKKDLQGYIDNALEMTNGFIDRSCGEYNDETDKCDRLKPITVKNEQTNPSLIVNVAELIATIE